MDQNLEEKLEQAKLKRKEILACFFDVVDRLIGRISKDSPFNLDAPTLVETAVTLTAAVFRDEFSPYIASKVDEEDSGEDSPDEELPEVL